MAGESDAHVHVLTTAAEDRDEQETGFSVSVHLVQQVQAWYPPSLEMSF